MSYRVYISVSVEEVPDFVAAVDPNTKFADALLDSVRKTPVTKKHTYDATLPAPDADHACLWLATILDPDHFKELTVDGE